MKENAIFVFNGFLQLPNLAKLEVVTAINDYFDSNEREPIRAAAEAEFAEERLKSPDEKCPCCGG
jgi:hypothetical protein